MTTFRCLWVLTLLACTDVSLHAEETSAEQLEQLVNRLGADDFTTRHRASKELALIVEEDARVADLLREYQAHPDPEVRMRVRAVLDKLGDLLEWMDPANEKKLKSGSGLYNSVSLDFRNSSKQEIKIFWIDREGERKAWRDVLKPGESYRCERTYESHVWLITDVDDEALGIYVVGNQNASILFRGVPAKPAPGAAGKQ